MLQTVSILEQRLTMTENKLKEVLDHRDKDDDQNHQEHATQ